MGGVLGMYDVRIQGDLMTFRCPYVDTKVYCNRRESIDSPTYACDSCYILWGEFEEEEERDSQ